MRHRGGKKRKKDNTSIRDTTFRARRMFIGIEFPRRSPLFRGSVSRDGYRGVVIQYSTGFPSKNKTGIGRSDRGLFTDGVPLTTYTQRVRLGRTTLHSRAPPPPRHSHPRLSTSIVEDMNTSNWQILSASRSTRTPRVCPPTRMRVRERHRHKYTKATRQ